MSAIHDAQQPMLGSSSDSPTFARHEFPSSPRRALSLRSFHFFALLCCDGPVATLPRPSFVLIPGAGGMAWYWHRVGPLLEQAGCECIAVDLASEDTSRWLIEGSRSLVRTAFIASVERAIARGDLRADTNPNDFVRALVGVFHTTALPGWEQSARRIVDILIAGSRPMPKRASLEPTAGSRSISASQREKGK
jgi:hypothetical protein